VPLGILNFKFTIRQNPLPKRRNNRNRKFSYLRHPAQITIDVLFNYLYYLPHTVESGPDSHPNQSGKDGECRNRRGKGIGGCHRFPCLGGTWTNVWGNLFSNSGGCMYSVVLLMAMSGPAADAPAGIFFHRHETNCSGCTGSACSGCTGYACSGSGCTGYACSGSGCTGYACSGCTGNACCGCHGSERHGFLGIFHRHHESCGCCGAQTSCGCSGAHACGCCGVAVSCGCCGAPVSTGCCGCMGSAPAAPGMGTQAPPVKMPEPPVKPK